MYLRHSRICKDGMTHTYWRLVRLVRSVRQGDRVRQETVAQPGELDADGRAKAQALARAMRGSSEQRELFEADTEACAPPIPVRLQEARLERGRRF